MLLKPFVNVTKAAVTQAAKFESLRARLTQLYGSAAEGKAAFDQFNATAAKTPFMLEDIVNAGAQFKAFGGDSRELLNEITDLAAYMGTTATEAANSLGRAYAGGAGAADILREKGVLNLVKEFKGIDDLSKLTLPEFRKALVETMQDPMMGIAGATNLMADTYEGRLSNMQDATSRMSAALGETLMPAAENLIEGMTKAANRVGDFFREWNESDMETMVRQMKDLGIAAKDLADFEIIIANEKALESITEISDSFSTMVEEALDLHRNMFTGLPGMGTAFRVLFGDLEEDAAQLNDKLKEQLGGTLKDIYASMPGTSGTGTPLFELDDVKAVTDAMMRLKGAIAENNLEVLQIGLNKDKLGDKFDEEFEDASRVTEVYAGLYKMLVQLKNAYDMQAESIEYLNSVKDGTDGKPKKIFEVEDQKFLEEFTKLLENSNKKRKEAVDLSIKQFKAYQAEGKFLKANKFDLEEQAIILEELIALRDRLDGKKVKPVESMDSTKFMEEITKQVEEYDAMQKILKEIEQSNFWDDVPEHLVKHTDAYIKNQEEIDGMKKRLESLWSGTKEGRKEAILGNIDFLESMKNNEEVLKQTGLTAKHLDIAISKLNGQYNKLIGVIELQSWDDFKKKMQETAIESVNLSMLNRLLESEYENLTGALKTYVGESLIGLKTIQDIDNEIDKQILLFNNNAEMIKHAEMRYFGLDEIGKQVVETMGLLSEEFMKMHGIGVESAIDQITEKLVGLYDETSKAKNRAYLDDLRVSRESIAALEEELDATDTSAQRKLEILNLLPKMQEGYKILNKEYQDWAKGLHNGGKAELRITQLKEKHSKLSKDSISDRQAEALAYYQMFDAQLEATLGESLFAKEKENARVALLEANAEMGNADAALNLYATELRNAKVAEEEHAAMIERLIQEYPDVAAMLGLVELGYKGYIATLQEARDAAEEENTFKMHLIRTDREQAQELGLLGETYDDFKDKLEIQEATRQHLIAKTIQLRQEEEALYNQMVKSGKIKSVEDLTTTKKDKTAYDRLVDSIKNKVKSNRNEQLAIINLKKDNEELYDIGVALNIINEEKNEIDEQTAGYQKDLSSRYKNLHDTQVNYLNGLLQQVFAEKALWESNEALRDAGKEHEIVVEALIKGYDNYDALIEDIRLSFVALADQEQQVIDAENEILKQREKLLAQDAGDILGSPTTIGEAFLGGSRFASQIAELEDYKTAWEEAANEAGYSEEQISQALQKIDKTIENVKLSDKVLQIGEALLQIADMALDTLGMLADNYSDRVEAAYNEDMERLKSQDKYTSASAEDQIKMENKVKRAHADEREKAFNYQKGIQMGEIAMNTANAVMGAIASFPATVGSPWKEIIMAFGGIQMGIVAGQQPPKYQEGGYIGGRPHSQGGTLIEAELGEYIINKESAKRIGYSKLNKINEMASGGMIMPQMYANGGMVNGNRPSNNINIVFEGNILSDDFINEEAIPKIREAIRRGEDLL